MLLKNISVVLTYKVSTLLRKKSTLEIISYVKLVRGYISLQGQLHILT